MTSQNNHPSDPNPINSKSVIKRLGVQREPSEWALAESAQIIRSYHKKLQLWRAIAESLDFTAMKAREDEREVIAKDLEMPTQELLLHTGELTSREIRTIKAVLKWKASIIRHRTDTKEGI